MTAAAVLFFTGLSLHVVSVHAVKATDNIQNRPLNKVIGLLKDMLKQLEKEAAEDEEIYDNLACWCETNDKEKKKSIANAEARITVLTTKIEEYTATSARLGTEIENLDKEVASNQEALAQATSIRDKQIAEFSSEEKDLTESIESLKAAKNVLSKHQKSFLLQVPRSHILGATAALQHVMDQHSVLLKGVLTHRQRREAALFIQNADERAPASGEIFGVIGQMKDTFVKNLDAAQKQEMSNQKAYEELKAAKGDEIAAGQQQVEAKTEELSDTDEKLAHSKEDIEDTRKTLAADEEFLLMLKDKCSVTDKEWEQRQKTRQQEMEAVSKALAVLSSDDAHDTFTRTFSPSFIQQLGSISAKRRNEASQLLAKVANKVQSPNLANLAVKVRLDAFTRVKKAIDDMVKQLLKQKEDEIKHKDFCVDEFNTNEQQTEKKTRQKSDLLAKIEDLQLNIKELFKTVDSLKADVAEMQVQLKRAGEDREKENREFQMTVADQRSTQKLLRAALNVLKGFYEKRAFVQKQEPAGPPPPPGFKDYQKSEMSGGVMDMIQQIIDDARSMEAEVVRAEEDAQKAYEEFVKETNKSIGAKSKDIVNKSETRSTAETDLVEAKESKEAVLVELGQLSDYNAELHQSCDFVMKNFELRQTARDEEIEALRQAKAILSGAKFAEFLQGQ